MFLSVKGGCTNKKLVPAQITLKRLVTVATGSRFIAFDDLFYYEIAFTLVSCEKDQFSIRSRDFFGP